MITIKTKIKNNRVEPLIQTIYQTCKTDPHLSPRSKEELFKAYKKGYFLIVVNGSLPVGWIMRIPLTKDVQELAAGYVVDAYRAKGVFTQLLLKSFNYTTISIIVTFNKKLAKYLKNKIGFEKTTFWKILKISKGKFVLNRLNIDRLKAIKRHYQTGRPIYLVHYKNG